jgi:hypothetical protein
MLISKINPPAKKNVGVNPFSSTTIDLNYMTAIARPYAPGADVTNFQVQFGTLTLNESNVAESFSNQSSTQLRLTKEELETWGTNDEVLLNIVATKLGVTVIEFVEVPNNSF